MSRTTRVAGFALTGILMFTGFALAQREYDNDDNGSNVAQHSGYEDGEQAAREDIEHRKDYNSKPRGRFGDRDHGYRREFGSRDLYKSEYTAGYRAGYDAVMRQRY